MRMPKRNLTDSKLQQSQKKNSTIEKDGKELREHKNTYYITSFLTSEMECDLDEAVE